MGIKKGKVLPHSMLVSHLVLASPRWTGGSHCKPQAYNVGGRGGAESGRWSLILRYFNSGGVDTVEDPVGGTLKLDCGGRPFYI